MKTRWSLVVTLINLALVSAACNQRVEGEGTAPAPLAVQIGTPLTKVQNMLASVWLPNMKPGCLPSIHFGLYL